MVYLFSVLFCLISCAVAKEDSLKQEPANTAGVALTFDGYSVKQWAALGPFLKQYKARCTFFISRINKIKPPQIKQLQQLQSDGHEIGCSNLSKRNPLKFIKKNSLDAFIKMEIRPAMEILLMNNLNFESFGYAYFESSPPLEDALQLKFKQVRYAGKKENTLLKDFNPVYFNFNKAQKITGAGISNGYQVTGGEIREAMEKALAEKTVLILIAHQPGNEPGDHFIPISKIKGILDFVKNNKMQFYRISDLTPLK